MGHGIGGYLFDPPPYSVQCLNSAYLRVSMLFYHPSVNPGPSVWERPQRFLVMLCRSSEKRTYSLMSTVSHQRSVPPVLQTGTVTGCLTYLSVPQFACCFLHRWVSVWVAGSCRHSSVYIKRRVSLFDQVCWSIASFTHVALRQDRMRSCLIILASFTFAFQFYVKTNTPIPWRWIPRAVDNRLLALVIDAGQC